MNGNTRRQFLQAVVPAVVGIVAPPMLIPERLSRGLPALPSEPTLQQLASWFAAKRYHPRGVFAAEAVVQPEEVMKVRGPEASLAAIQNMVGIRRDVYRAAADMTDADACEGNLKECETRMRRQGLTRFSPVRRSPISPDLVLFTARQEGHPENAQGSLQFDSGDAVTMSGVEPDVIRGVNDYLRRRYGLGGRELVRSVALTKREDTPVMTRDGQPLVINRRPYVMKAFVNARGGTFLYDPIPDDRATAGYALVYDPRLTGSKDPIELGLRV